MTPLHTFVFADLAGFTATTEAHGDDHAADVAGAFVDAMRGLLPGHEAREVKTMGDAVMLHVADAERALCLAECAVGELGARHGELGVRVGMHTGPAVHRRGDWFGATVNTASRVADLARADEVLVTSATLAAARSRGDHPTIALGITRLRNVREPVELHALDIQRPAASLLAFDPVCRMAVDPAAAAESAVRDGVAHHFCSTHCARTFAQQPALYAERLSVTR